jgi:tRNA(Ile)-lysidine synthase
MIDFSKYLTSDDIVAVALSGGRDSMALLHMLLSVLPKNRLKAINVEHGIRGEESLLDSKFVASQCKALCVPLLTYSIDCVKEAKKQKLSIEQVARKLRYECFYDALSKGKCDKIATAHHNDDNIESVLFNLFRGTGLKGLIGISDNLSDKIIRPLLDVSKDEINEYIKKHDIPFVKDSTNDDDKYTRNFIRLNIIPKIKRKIKLCLF